MFNEYDTPTCAPIVSPEDARIARRANILAWAVVGAFVLVVIAVASYTGRHGWTERRRRDARCRMTAARCLTALLVLAVASVAYGEWSLVAAMVRVGGVR